jgi:uncharacterized ion transporter superfamily protein YfcC
MTQIQIPWGLIAIFISLSLFYYFNQKNKIKKEERREKLNESRQQLLDSMLKTKSEETNKEFDEEK